MEPAMAHNGIVLVNTTENNPYKLKPGKIYVLRWELTEGECAVKYFSLTTNLSISRFLSGFERPTKT
jgi:hypothetical protein